MARPQLLGDVGDVGAGFDVWTLAPPVLGSIGGVGGGYLAHRLKGTTAWTVGGAVGGLVIGGGLGALGEWLVARKSAAPTPQVTDEDISTYLQACPNNVLWGDRLLCWASAVNSSIGEMQSVATLTQQFAAGYQQAPAYSDPTLQAQAESLKPKLAQLVAAVQSSVAGLKQIAQAIQNYATSWKDTEQNAQNAGDQQSLDDAENVIAGDVKKTILPLAKTALKYVIWGRQVQALVGQAAAWDTGFIAETQNTIEDLVKSQDSLSFGLGGFLDSVKAGLKWLVGIGVFGLAAYVGIKVYREAKYGKRHGTHYPERHQLVHHREEPEDADYEEEEDEDA